MNFGDLLSVLLVALGVAADCFAVALCGNLSGHLRFAQIVRAAFSFGFFQAAMCSLGWLAGTNIIDIIAGYDHWVAFGLLVLIGGRMVWESRRKEESSQRDVTRGWQLIVLSFATSIDALAAGLSVGVFKIGIITIAVIVGLTSFFIALLGFYIGRRTGRLIGRRAEAVGGVVLIIIGLRVLITHLF